MAIHPSAMLPGERVLLEANGGILILTTHRVRLTQRGNGGTKVVSIILSAVASCGLSTTTYPALLGLGLIAGIAGIGLLMSSAENLGLYFLVIALVCTLAFLVGRRAILEVASAGHKIQVNARGMGHDALMQFIDSLERAKLTLPPTTGR
jgi:hypothetical protein